MSARRMLPFILINIVVSAVVMLAILYYWENQRAENTPLVAQTAVANADLSTPAVLPVVSAATDTPEAPPEPEGPPVHVVRAGDTLATIAQIYDVPMDDIVTANNIANPNFLSVGDQLVIPVGGLATATPPPSEPTPVVSPTPIAAEPVTVTQGSEAVVGITAVIAPSDINNEAVQIVNSGSSPIALLGWKIVDQQNQFYTFKQVTLFGDGAGILFHTGTGRDGATDVYWGRTEAVWQPGELVTLLDGQDNIIATFTVPIE
ncbi:MAG: lamin tail domain-containing protein [Anaerolineae bacterium]|nr:lamin tail domain-containing protein [Anaerolineae bacterium]